MLAILKQLELKLPEPLLVKLELRALGRSHNLYVLLRARSRLPIPVHMSLVARHSLRRAYECSRAAVPS